ncbi:predicted protein [Postia placenta Mad-698-R]|nr:predicted protein [Postia placenta Mad-698-R]
MTVFPSYRRGRRSFNVSLSGAAAGEDIIGDEGDKGLPVDGGDCCDCPSGELREERVLGQPRGGDGGEGAGGSPGEGLPRVILLNRSGCPIWAWLLLATVEDSLRAVWDVNVDEILGVECVNLALTGSHDGWGEDGEEVNGRLCALVRAQLVRAQHADAAPGAVDNNVSISGR